MKKFIFIFFVSNYIISCGPLAGTLGGFHERTFPIEKQRFIKCLDSLYGKYPEYIIPSKWEFQNDWSQRGYNFLESRIFYFKSFPEEMYYVTIQDTENSSSTKNIGIAVRSVFKGNANRWYLNDDCDSKERKRIENRFDTEIITKLEELTKTKAN